VLGIKIGDANLPAGMGNDGTECSREGAFSDSALL
jgi:hypothetical protein